MVTHKQINFDDALEAAIRITTKAKGILAPNDESIMIVRDLTGRLRVFVDRDQPCDSKEIRGFEQEFRSSTGAYAALGAFLFWHDNILAPHVLHESSDAWNCNKDDAPANLRIIDRLVTGREWLLEPVTIKPTTPPRLVFFGLKGGVGRSTALSMLAWHLSRQGKNVLVVDLDLESPGLGHSLLPANNDPESSLIRDWPQFGVVDWLVEDLVGQADSILRENDLWARSPLSTLGDIWVVPAMGGRRDQDYIGKLSRAYVDVPTANGRAEYFGDRIARFISALESKIKPDVVLLDSRAGLHDISSALLTRLDARLSLFFAIDSNQTWAGLRTLFRHWQRKPETLRKLRERLITIAALVPETEYWPSYREGFCERAYDTFQEIYDSVAPGDSESDDSFSFSLNDEPAPHAPVRIERHPAYSLFAPLEQKVQIDDTKVNQAFGEFFDKIDFILGEDQA